MRTIKSSQKILLDTHSFIWITSDKKQLSKRAQAIFLEETNEFLLSLASVWELAIKSNLGKIQLPKPIKDFVNTSTQELGIQLFGIELSHLLELEDLPNHHRDPFDRLLIAQAKHERISILGSDEAFDEYGITRIW